MWRLQQKFPVTSHLSQKPQNIFHVYYTYCIVYLVLRGRWMLESDWLTNVLRCVIIFRETHGERSSRHRITCPHHFAKWFELFQRYLQQPKKQQKNQTHNDTGQTNKYSKQKDKNDRSYPCFCHKLRFIMYGMHTLSLSLTDSLSTR